MNIINLWAVGASFLYMIVLALATTTKNLTSAIVFKVVPFLIGVLNLVVFLKLMGIV